jgi:hypothetical protein
MVVASFGDLIQYYNEWSLTHISQVLSYSAIIEGVGYKVHRYITTGALPYEKLSEERPWTNKAEW